MEIGQWLERHKLFWVLILLYLFVPFALFFSDFFLLKKIFYFFDIGSDTINLYFPWLRHYAIVEDKNFFHWWSFYMGIGQVFPTFLVLEPTWLIFNHYIFFWKEAYLYSFHILYFGEILVSAFVMYYFFREIGLKKIPSLLGALFWQFSGYMIVGAAWYVFPYTIMAGSFIFLGLEKMLKGKNPIWFIYGVYLLSYNLYFFLTFSIFFFLYFLGRILELQWEWKTIKKLLLKIVGWGTLAVLADLVNLLPRWQQIIFSPRVAGDVSSFSMLISQPLWDGRRIATTILRFFGNDMAGYATDTQIWHNYLEAPLFYVGLFSLLTIPQFFVFAKKRQLRIWGLFLIFWLLVAFIPQLRHTINLFAGDYFRGTIDFFLSSTLLIIAMRGFDLVIRHRAINVKVLIFSVVFYATMILLAQVIDDIRSNKLLISAVFLFFFAEGYLLFMTTTEYRKLGFILLLIVLPLEAGFLSRPAYYHRVVADHNFIYNWGGYRDNTLKALEVIRSQDTSKFYRVEKEYRSGLAIHASTNDAMVQDYFGTMSYNSFNNLNYVRFLEYAKVVNPLSESQTRWVHGVVGYPLMMSLMGVKYFLTKDFNSPLLKLGYNAIDTVGNILILRNKYALPLAFTYSKLIDERNFLSLDRFARQQAMLHAAVVDSSLLSQLPEFPLIDTSKIIPEKVFSLLDYDSLVQALKEPYVKLLSFTQDRISLKIYTDSIRILAFSIPYDQGWKVRDNGIYVKTFRINGGLLAMKLMPGKHHIDLVFRTPFYWLSLIISLIAFLFIVVLLIRQKF